MKCIKEYNVYKDGRRIVYLHGHINFPDRVIYDNYPFVIYYDYAYSVKINFVTGCDVNKAVKIAKATLSIKAIKKHLIASRMQKHLTIEKINSIITTLINYKLG